MKKSLFFIFIFIMLCSICFATQSTIVISEGSSCMGDDKSRKQTEQVALEEAKRNAIEQVATYVKSKTEVENLELKKDLIQAYSQAKVKILKEVEKSWYKDPSTGDCYRIKIQAEVIPDEDAMKKLSNVEELDNPTAPLKVKTWTDKKRYKKSDRVKIYLKGNKPFYAYVIYKDANGKLLQLLPNPYRQDNYFNGGVLYEIPSGNDRFELDVSPPFGEEELIVYASTNKLGDLDVETAGGVYKIMSKFKEVAEKTRGIKIVEKNSGSASEFFESKIKLDTE